MGGQVKHVPLILSRGTQISHELNHLGRGKLVDGGVAAMRARLVLEERSTMPAM